MYINLITQLYEINQKQQQHIKKGSPFGSAYFKLKIKYEFIHEITIFKILKESNKQEWKDLQMHKSYWHFFIHTLNYYPA